MKRQDLLVVGAQTAPSAKQTSWCALLVALVAAHVDIASGAQVDEHDYARAVSFLPFNLMDKVRNARVDPHWIDGGQRFWYWRDTESDAH